MSYIEITRGKFGGSAMPDNVIRINKSTISIAPNIAGRFQLRRTSNPSAKTDREMVSIGLAFDSANQRIKLLPDAINGFSFSTSSESRSDSLSVAKPKGLVRLGVDIGDYLLVGPTENLEFQKA